MSEDSAQVKEKFQKLIEQNNASHTVDEAQLKELLSKAESVFKAHHKNTVHFERSIFTNWTCAIADCKYCYLSTKPKHVAKPLKKNSVQLNVITPKSTSKSKKAPAPLRSQASILAEVLVCKTFGWKVGYITGGLRVEATEKLIDLLNKIECIYEEQIMMNYGPYSEKEVQLLAPHLTGMGSAIESFNEELHNFICPSKPLSALKRFLGYLQDNDKEKLITIILGMGETKEDIHEVIKQIKHYGINKVQLCFLKPQEGTIFSKVPPPDMNYMAWWAATLRIEFPDLILKVALVKERIEDFHLLLKAGINSFSRFMIYKDFCSEFADTLANEATKANRQLVGNFTDLPEISKEQLIEKIPLSFKEQFPILTTQVEEKALQYFAKLQKLSTKTKTK